MFPNYQAPDSIIVIQQQQSELKRKNSIKSVKSLKSVKNTAVTAVDNPTKGTKSSSGALRDFFTSMKILQIDHFYHVEIVAFLVVALSTHAVFEGLAVGLEESNKDVWTMFIGKYRVSQKCSYFVDIWFKYGNIFGTLCRYNLHFCKYFKKPIFMVLCILY